MTLIVEPISFSLHLLYSSLGDKMKDELRELIISNQNLIYSIATKFKGEIDDLFQAGCLGLIDAYYKYDKSFNTKFTTYAYPFIMGSIYKYVLGNKNIKVSPDVIKLKQAIKKADDYLTQKLNRSPTDLELSNFLEIPISKLGEVKNLETLSLDDTKNDTNLYDFISLDNINKDDLILLRDALNKLENKEKELILKRYFYNMTQSEVAKSLGVNQVKVSREEGKILKKLKTYM